MFVAFFFLSFSFDIIAAPYFLPAPLSESGSIAFSPANGQTWSHTFGRSSRAKARQPIPKGEAKGKPVRVCGQKEGGVYKGGGVYRAYFEFFTIANSRKEE